MAPRVELIFAGADEGATATAISAKEAVDGLAASAAQADETISKWTGTAAVEFQRLDSVTQQLSADYAAGLVTQQEWTDGLEAARAQAIALRQATGDLSNKELRGFTGVLSKTADASSGASFHMNGLRNATRALAQQAAGVQGPVGGFIQQLLMMGGGSELVIGVAATVGILALAIKALASEAMKADQAQRDAIKSLLQLREASRSDEAKQADLVAAAREKLTTINRDLAAAEEDLAAIRRGDSGHDELTVEEEVNRLIEERQHTMEAISAPQHAQAARERTAHEKAYKDAVDEANQSLAVTAIRLAAAGDYYGKNVWTQNQLNEALLRQQLAHKGLTAAEIDHLVQLEREATKNKQEIADLQAIARLMLEITGLRLNLRASDLQTAEEGGRQDPGLRRGIVRDVARPATPPAKSAGPGTVDTEQLGQSEELALRMADSFGLSIDMVDDLKHSIDDLANTSVAALGDAFEHVFAAIIEGGRVSGAEMMAGLLGAISKAAIHESAFYFARGLAALAGATFPVPNPKNAVSAGQYFQAAGIMAAIGVGTGLAAGAVGGGGGGSSNLGSDRVREDRRTVSALKGSGTIVIKGKWRPGDPEFVQDVADAVQEMIDKRVTDIEFVVED